MDWVVCLNCKGSTRIDGAYSMEGSAIYCECGALQHLGSAARKAAERRRMQIRFEVWNDKWVFDCSVCGFDHHKDNCREAGRNG